MQVALRKMQSQLGSDPEQNIHNNNSYNMNFISPHWHARKKFLKKYKTRLPSNLRPTTRECVHLVTRGRLQSGDKDGGHHSICKSRKPHDTRKPHGCIFYITGVMVIEVLHCENRNFGDLFAHVTLTSTR